MLFNIIQYTYYIESKVQLLKGCSYNEVVIPNFIFKYGEDLPNSYNAMILLYDLRYTQERDNEIDHVKYIGCIRYK